MNERRMYRKRRGGVAGGGKRGDKKRKKGVRVKDKNDEWRGSEEVGKVMK